MTMTAEKREMQFEHELRSAGCIHEGLHLHLKSGRHAEIYIDCDPLFTQAWRLRHFYRRWLGEWFEDVSLDERPEAIASPAVGGVFLVGGMAQALAEANRLNVRTVWADKDGQGFELERAGFKSAVQGRRVLIIEDVITTGGSTAKTIEVVRAAGGTVIGVACIVNRTKRVTAFTLDVPRLTVCWQLDVPSYALEDCPFCKEQRPMVTNLAHGKVFQEQFPGYIGGYEVFG